MALFYPHHTIFRQTHIADEGLEREALSVGLTHKHTHDTQHEAFGWFFASKFKCTLLQFDGCHYFGGEILNVFRYI